jgi:drug/metabolite transporter (DMT)-like permease
MRIVLSLLITFWVMQIVSQLIYKYGSESPQRWLWGFIVGNVIGVSSMWLQMKLYTRMDAALAMGLGIGGAFLFSQLALTAVFHVRPSGLQWLAYGMIAGGMILAAFGTGKHEFDLT